MSIPLASFYPESLDNNRNLFLTHDSLRVTLAETYRPGDTRIVVYPNPDTLVKFPPSGLITLTEQCSDIEDRVVSFFYNKRTLTGFEGLEVLPGFNNTLKPKDITHVTQNVMADHHNHLKDALIAIETFVGVKGTVDDKPFGPTMEGRINFLRKLVLSPKAWFSVNKTVGLVPLTVEFKDLSFRLGTDGNAGTVTAVWDFGDNTASTISVIEVSTDVPMHLTNVIVKDTDRGIIRKTYDSPNVYNVKLTVTNDFGSDTVILPALINARVAAPDPAVIEYRPRTGQILTPGQLEDGIYTSPPVLRAATNSLIEVGIGEGLNVATGRSYGGEALRAGTMTPIDPIQNYSWAIPDDLEHGNSRSTRAVFSLGGIYDLILRVDTRYGSYRLTTYENSLDIIEKANLWLWLYSASKTVRAYEYGLMSETFKIKPGAELTLETNSSFLSGQPNERKQKDEFKRNNGFAPQGTQPSGSQGQGLLYWASGRAASEPVSAEEILFRQYTGFTDTYVTKPSVTRPWNWVGMNSLNALYFLLGENDSEPIPFQSPTNNNKTTINLSNGTVSSVELLDSDCKDGAEEAKQNVANYDSSGEAVDGHFSVYRAAWKDSTGYFMRNDGVGSFFRLKNFYRTESVGGVEFQGVRKLPDITGPARLEGQLVSLSNGIYFFNNSGSISAYNDVTGTWENASPESNSAQFRSLQDSSVINYDSDSQQLCATSDGDKTVYLSYDYSERAFIKFNASTLSFSALNTRPAGDQWQMHIY